MLLIGNTIETNMFNVFLIFNDNYDPLIDYLTDCKLILDVTKPSRDNEYTQQNLPFTF